MLETEILHAFENSKKIYRSPQATQELRKNNIKVSRSRVARMMRKANLRSIVKKKFKVATDPTISSLFRKIGWIVILSQEC